jgi:hypothetical protein
MRKQARRLWLGDWNRDQDEAPPQPVDTFVITPEDDVEAQPVEHRRIVQRRVAGLAAIALLAALGFAVSSGGSDNPVASVEGQAPAAQAPQTQIPQAQIPQAPSQVPQGAPPQGFGGPDLTGAEATKAAQAAVAKYPGDVERVTRGTGGGGYIVHVIQPDGNEVHVVVDDQFKVQGSEDGAPSAAGPGTSQ